MHSSGWCNLETNSPFHLKMTRITVSIQKVLLLSALCIFFKKKPGTKQQEWWGEQP